MLTQVLILKPETKPAVPQYSSRNKRSGRFVMDDEVKLPVTRSPKLGALTSTHDSVSCDKLPHRQLGAD